MNALAGKAGRQARTLHFAFQFILLLRSLLLFHLPFAVAAAATVVVLVVVAVAALVWLLCFISKDFALVCIKISLCCLAL